MQWVSLNSRSLVMLNFSSSLSNRRPFWTSSASFPIQVINMATQRRFVLFQRLVTSSYASQTCRHCFHSLDKFPLWISLFGGKDTLHIKVEAIVVVDEGVGAGTVTPDCEVELSSSVIQLHLSSLWIWSFPLINTPSFSIKALSFRFWNHERCGLLVPKLNWLTSGHVIRSTNNVISSQPIGPLVPHTSKKATIANDYAC